MTHINRRIISRQSTTADRNLNSPKGPVKNDGENRPKCFDQILQYDVHRAAHTLVSIFPRGYPIHFRLLQVLHNKIENKLSRNVEFVLITEKLGSLHT